LPPRSILLWKVSHVARFRVDPQRISRTIASLECGMTITNLPGNRVLPHLDRISLERADIQKRVETFRQHQARQQAERERRWARVIAETRASITKD